MQHELHLKRLKDIREFRDDDGNVEARKETTVDLIERAGIQLIAKRWHGGDWVFGGDYEYAVEKHVYIVGNERGLPIPRLLDFDDDRRTLYLQLIEGSTVEAPCSDLELLPEVVAFQDEYKRIEFPADLGLSRMDDEDIHKYRADHLDYLFGPGELRDTVDRLYEAFLKFEDSVTIPFDRVLHHVFRTNSGLIFYDFEWTIAGPYEFTLARIAVEFNAYDHELIQSRVLSRDLYLLFLIRFYLYGREPEYLRPYLSSQVENPDMRSLFRIVDENVRARPRS